MPISTVRHCFRLPQTVIVRAPASLFVWKEAMLRTKARKPLPLRDVMVGASEMSPDTRSRNPATSSVKVAQARACRAARGDMRMTNSIGGNASDPVMKRLVTTVWELSEQGTRRLRVDVP